MKKSLLYVGVMGATFIVLVGLTFLTPRTYQSQFTIVRESENVVNHNRVMVLNNTENYDLGITRTDNALGAYAYKELVYSDQFLRPLLQMHVQTLNGEFDGTYQDYCTHYCKKPLFARIMECIMPSPSQTTAHKEVSPSVHWVSPKEELIKEGLSKAITTEVDYETGYVTISCVSQDPLVSTMMAEAVNKALLTYINDYEQAKMRGTAEQLDNLVSQYQAQYEQSTGADKELNKTILESFQRQAVIYRAQMVSHRAYTTLSEPSFSYRKVGPNRFKLPLLLTILLGVIWLGWTNRKCIYSYLRQ